MPHPKPRAPGTTTWRDVRAKTVRAGRLNEEAVEARKRRLLAEEHAYTERQQDEEADDA